jgi:membrane-bound ClpP family serine protease
LFEALDGARFKRFDGRTEILHPACRCRSIRPDHAGADHQRIADPNIGFISGAGRWAYVEFNFTGLIFPGSRGGISLLMGFIAGCASAQLGRVSLLLLGGALFVLEAHFTSHGVLGTGVPVAMVLGALMLIDGHRRCDSPGDGAIGVDSLRPDHDVSC